MRRKKRELLETRTTRKERDLAVQICGTVMRDVRHQRMVVLAEVMSLLAAFCMRHSDGGELFLEGLLEDVAEQAVYYHELDIFVEVS